LGADQLAELFSLIYLDGAVASPGRIELTLPGFGKRAEKNLAKGRKPSVAARTGTSQRLVDAAASLFSRKGYEATSTREIAAALRIQKASLYYHIESKEQLLVAICKSSLEQIRGDVEAAICGIAEPLERIRVLVSTHIESMLRDQEKHSVAVAEMHLLSPGHYGEIRLLRDSYESLVRSVLQAAQQAGVLRGDIPVKYLCLGLLGLMNRVEVWYRRNGALSPGEFGLLLAAIFLTGAVSRPRD
jgi:AcrR family transcriptional regulator